MQDICIEAVGRENERIIWLDYLARMVCAEWQMRN